MPPVQNVNICGFQATESGHGRGNNSRIWGSTRGRPRQIGARPDSKSWARPRMFTLGVPSGRLSDLFVDDLEPLSTPRVLMRRR